MSGIKDYLLLSPRHGWGLIGTCYTLERDHIVIPQAWLGLLERDHIVIIIIIIIDHFLETHISAYGRAYDALQSFTPIYQSLGPHIQH